MRGRAQDKHGGDNGEGSEEDEAESEQGLSLQIVANVSCNIS